MSYVIFTFTHTQDYNHDVRNLHFIRDIEIPYNIFSIIQDNRNYFSRILIFILSSELVMNGKTPYVLNMTEKIMMWRHHTMYNLIKLIFYLHKI